MSYCNGCCKYLDEKKHQCKKTGERLTYMKVSGAISYTVHEHKEKCGQM